MALAMLHVLTVICQNWYDNAEPRRRLFSKISSDSFLPQRRTSALFKRERRRYFSTPVYPTNTFYGFLFAAIYVIFIGTANEKSFRL